MRTDLEMGVPPGWVYWIPGLREGALAAMAAGVKGVATEEAAMAIAALDEMAVGDASVEVCGLWFPEATKHLTATLLVRAYESKEPPDRRVAEYLNLSQQPPPMPGCLISHYAVTNDRVDLGPLIRHVLLYADEQGKMVWLTRYTVFSETKPLAVEFDFNLLLMGLSDELHESAGLLVGSARHAKEEE